MALNQPPLPAEEQQRLSLGEMLRLAVDHAGPGLGLRRVAWAVAALATGLVCVVASIFVMASALSNAEVTSRSHLASEVLSLDSAMRDLLRKLLGTGPTSLENVNRPVEEVWTDFAVALAQLCVRLEDPPVAPFQRIAEVCARREAIVRLFAPQIERLARDGTPLSGPVLGELLAVRDPISALNLTVARESNDLVTQLTRVSRTALAVLIVSSFGFAGAGIVLVLIVGRISILNFLQSRKANEAAELLRETLDVLPAGVVVYDRDERLMLFNAVAASNSPALREGNPIGRTYEEMVRENARKLEAAGKGPQPVEKSLARFRSKGMHELRPAFDGRLFEWSEQGTPSGRTVGLRVDVTALETARSEYQSLVDSLNDVVFKLDLRNGRFVFASAKAAELLGLPVEELLRRRFVDFVAEEDRAPLLDSSRRAVASTDDFAEERRFRMIRIDGSVRHVESRTRKTVDGQGNALLVGVLHDIEERVELERRLDEERARLRSIFESSGALMVLVDADLFVTMVNSGFTAVTGIAEEMAVGRPLGEVLDCPLDAATIAAWRASALDRQDVKPFHGAVKLAGSPGGGPRLVAVTATPVSDASGRMASIVLLGVDETARREAEAALHDVERFATVGEMAAMMAHEISQPLQVINIASTAAAEELSEPGDPAKGPDTEYLRLRLQRIGQQVEKASRVVGDFRAYVRGANTPESVGLFDPGGCIDYAVNLTDYGLRQSGIELKVRRPASLPRLSGEPGRLEQVLVNLINNAREAGGRSITVAAETIEQDGRAGLRLIVEDTGPGIAADVLPRLFESFVTTKERGKGTGLGLRICRRIVEELGGTITAANRAEGGARFEILLPAGAEAAPGAMPSTEPAS